MSNEKPNENASEKHLENSTEELINPILGRRRAGVLLHPTSLPCGEEVGELGHDAFRFIEFLQAAGITVWQVLPLGPTHADLSPYMSPSVHAGNPRMISLERLHECGWLDKNLEVSGDTQQRHRKLLRAALRGFEANASEQDRLAYRAYQEKHKLWLEDFAIYQSLRHLHRGLSWTEWPQGLRDRDPRALNEAHIELADDIEQACFEQFVFYNQWLEIKQYANDHGILLLGDIPIFVAHDSAEVWACREYFDLDNEGHPRTVAGVPPDYFSETGQLWGNPHYCWSRMAEDGYQWWINRLHTALSLFDEVRIDHFRGFEAYWEIDAGAETAMDGRWVKGPGEDLFEALKKEFPHLPLVAEDLGIITPEVEQLRDHYGLPGMKILQFAFDGNPENPYLTHNHPVNSVVYTGTHDNNTSLGWYEELDENTQSYVRDYLGVGEDVFMPWAMINAALSSPARLAMIPMQDLLGLGSEARMNVPGAAEDNWRWRFRWDQVPPELASRLAHVVRLYGR